VDHVQQLLRLVQRLSREAEQAARTGGRRELDALRATAEQYLKLYDELKARGEIE
jgi:molybdenum-dependent DNA-binding transcriptional regulator ModE